MEILFEIDCYQPRHLRGVSAMNRHARLLCSRWQESGEERTARAIAERGRGGEYGVDAHLWGLAVSLTVHNSILVL